jgi:hypothetical protein
VGRSLVPGPARTNASARLRVGVCASAHACGSDAPAVWTPRALSIGSLVDEAGVAVVFRGSCAGDTAQWVSQNG